MKKHALLFLAALMCSMVHAAAPETAAPTEAAPASKAAKDTLPKLVISWNCGKCELNDKVPGLIEQSYANKAAAEGLKVSDTETAEVVITEFRQRPPGIRVSFGFWAGKDILGVKINYRGKEFVAKDSTNSPYVGMNSLCETVGKDSLSKLIEFIRADAPTESNAQL